MTRFTGLIAAPFTAMREDGSLDLTKVAPQARALRESGVRGAFICGTTGEGLSLSTEERLEVAEAWAEHKGDLTLFVHVGHASLKDSQRLAAHAEEVGADAVSAMPSSPYPSTLKSAVRTCAEMAAAAPTLPFFYYHIPSLSGVAVPMRHFLPKAVDAVPTLAGVKFTFEDLMDYALCLDLYGDLDLLFGRDELLLAGLSLGAKGAVGSTYNFAAPLYRRVMDAFAQGRSEEARAAQLEAQRVIATLLEYPGLAAFKAAMKLVGQDLGPVRPPLQRLTEAQERELLSRLEAQGFAALCRGEVPVA